MSYRISKVEGIGSAHATKLATAGIKKTDDLLNHCRTADGRKAVSKATGISERQILKWANLADLMRISGVGEEFSELLEAAGVDTVKELKHRNAENLAAQMAEVNRKKKLTRRVPAASQVARWITQAKRLQPTISH